ncbi:hypothetical protein E2C01_044723 [Portunus trituberculatus]|uniref:Uncharacterized protein n=1 Tax=Portunus trituberculatus TaxID=210409 RepID=A0A5B7G0A1_PORTR|nr:hypothetical protein [Portunus trituberculatus]
MWTACGLALCGDGRWTKGVNTEYGRGKLFSSSSRILQLQDIQSLPALLASSLRAFALLLPLYAPCHSFRPSVLPRFSKSPLNPFAT